MVWTGAPTKLLKPVEALERAIPIAVFAGIAFVKDVLSKYHLPESLYVVDRADVNPFTVVLVTFRLLSEKDRFVPVVTVSQAAAIELKSKVPLAVKL
jgi:hypothetical protein